MTNEWREQLTGMTVKWDGCSHLNFKNKTNKGGAYMSKKPFRQPKYAITITNTFTGQYVRFGVEDLLDLRKKGLSQGTAFREILDKALEELK